MGYEAYSKYFSRRKVNVVTRAQVKKLKRGHRVDYQNLTWGHFCNLMRGLVSTLMQPGAIFTTAY